MTENKRERYKNKFDKNMNHYQNITRFVITDTQECDNDRIASEITLDAVVKMLQDANFAHEITFERKNHLILKVHAILDKVKLEDELK